MVHHLNSAGIAAMNLKLSDKSIAILSYAHGIAETEIFRGK